MLCLLSTEVIPHFQLNDHIGIFLGVNKTYDSVLHSVGFECAQELCENFLLCAVTIQIFRVPFHIVNPLHSKKYFGCITTS